MSLINPSTIGQRIPYFQYPDFQFDSNQIPDEKNIKNNKKETTSTGRLYNDDLIIIGLLFFLYTEKVNDTYLFIALIMLLMS